MNDLRKTSKLLLYSAYRTIGALTGNVDMQIYPTDVGAHLQKSAAVTKKESEKERKDETF
jgi:hypothetical protein